MTILHARIPDEYTASNLVMHLDDIGDALKSPELVDPNPFGKDYRIGKSQGVSTSLTWALDRRKAWKDRQITWMRNALQEMEDEQEDEALISRSALQVGSSAEYKQMPQDYRMAGGRTTCETFRVSFGPNDLMILEGLNEESDDSFPSDEEDEDRDLSEVVGKHHWDPIPASLKDGDKESAEQSSEQTQESTAAS